MLDFYTYSSNLRILITFILGILIICQTLTVVLTLYRRSLTPYKYLEIILEVTILMQALIFVVMHSQIVSAFSNGFVISPGYEGIRILIVIIIMVCAVLKTLINKKVLSLTIIFISIIALPITDKLLGHLFPFYFTSALVFLILRSTQIFVTTVAYINSDISALSVINAINSLDTGILFAKNNGQTLLSNYKIKSLMMTITGKVFRDANNFYKALESDEYEDLYTKSEVDGNVVYLLADDTAWMFARSNITIKKKNYKHISATNISNMWKMTEKLQNQKEILEIKSDQLKTTISNLYLISQTKELEKAKIRTHNLLGQRLSVLLRMIQNDDKLDYKLLMQLSDGLIEQLKEENSEITPKEELENIFNIFAAIGVEIHFTGILPKNDQESKLFIDIIREGCTNAVRHGLATEIKINSTLINDSYNLKITNEGYTVKNPIIPGGGIKAINKKLTDLGGNLEIESYPLFMLSADLPGGVTYD